MKGEQRIDRMRMLARVTRLDYSLPAAWVAFTVSLATWWLVFGLSQAEKIRLLDDHEAPQLERVQRMLIWEGAALIASLLGGGLALLYYVHRERDRQERMQQFFTAFTHDLKTSLASLRLQAESLEEDLGDSYKGAVLERLVKDSVRLQVQLENSLHLANLRSGELLLEKVALRRVIDTVRHHWPGLEIVLEEDRVVEADVRALESVIRNILQNSVLHGEASEVRIRPSAESNGRTRIVFEDNGRGSRGPRPETAKGTGLGLYIATELMKRMGGKLEIQPPPGRGFVVALEMRVVSS